MIHFLWKLLLNIKNPSCKIRTSHVGRNVIFSKGNYVGYGTVLAADKIGKYTYINDYCLIDRNVKSIGNFCSIAYHARIGLGSHPTDWVTTHPFPYQEKYKFRANSVNFGDEQNWETVIGNDVWIGANATILAGVKVGDGAIIGAHSLVTKDVKPYSVVVGSPARHVKYRFEEDVISRLQDSKWWNWSDDELRKKVNLFDSPEKLLNL
jgi:acetyltransferase-like isoleucine patch superfamily enzyme